MTIQLSLAAAIKAVNDLSASINAGTFSPTGTCTVYSGPKPAKATTALTGANVALVTFAFAADAFADAAENAADSVAEALANAIAETPALADGTASFCRVFNRDGTVLWQGDVTEVNLGGDMEVSSINVVENVNVVVQSFALRMPY